MGSEHGYHEMVPEGKIDRVCTAMEYGQVLILNHTKEKAVRDIGVSPGDVRMISLEADSIRALRRSSALSRAGVSPSPVIV